MTFCAIREEGFKKNLKKEKEKRGTEKVYTSVYLESKNVMSPIAKTFWKLTQPLDWQCPKMSFRFNLKVFLRKSILSFICKKVIPAQIRKFFCCNILASCPSLTKRIFPKSQTLYLSVIGLEIYETLLFHRFIEKIFL